MERKSKIDYYLDIAKAVSSRSTCLRRQYGAVIVKDDRIISTGYNGSPIGEPNCCDIGTCKRQEEGHAHNDGNYSSCESVHSEMNALLSAGREADGATLYLAGFEDGKLIDAVPCPVCERLIKNARIDAVIGTKADGTQSITLPQKRISDFIESFYGNLYSERHADDMPDSEDISECNPYEIP